MAEYIEREAVITLIEDKCTEGYELCMPMELKSHYVAGLHKAKQFVEKAPAADVVEVKHGEWIKREVSLSHKNETLAQCSVCGENGLVESAFPFESCVRRLKYCPYCGAKMDKKEGAEE